MPSWKCVKCDLFNSPYSGKCQACFNLKPKQLITSLHHKLTPESQLLKQLMVHGYIRNCIHSIVPLDIVKMCITYYDEVIYWKIHIDDTNSDTLIYGDEFNMHQITFTCSFEANPTYYKNQYSFMHLNVLLPDDVLEIKVYSEVYCPQIDALFRLNINFKQKSNFNQVWQNEQYTFDPLGQYENIFIGGYFEILSIKYTDYERYELLKTQKQAEKAAIRAKRKERDETRRDQKQNSKELDNDDEYLPDSDNATNDEDYDDTDTDLDILNFREPFYKPIYMKKQIYFEWNIGNKLMERFKISNPRQIFLSDTFDEINNNWGLWFVPMGEELDVILEERKALLLLWLYKMPSEIESLIVKGIIKNSYDNSETTFQRIFAADIDHWDIFEETILSSVLLNLNSLSLKLHFEIVSVTYVWCDDCDKSHEIIL